MWQLKIVSKPRKEKKKPSSSLEIRFGFESCKGVASQWNETAVAKDYQNFKTYKRLLG